MDEQRDVQLRRPLDARGTKKRYDTPILTIYGHLQQITGMVGTTGLKDGASGQKNVRSQP
jgi:hypothetical protein